MRPCLVEEGKPISQQTYDCDHDHDGVRGQMSVLDQGFNANDGSGQGGRTKSSHTNPSSLSSLSRLARKNSSCTPSESIKNKKSYRLATSIQIGGYKQPLPEAVHGCGDDNDDGDEDMSMFGGHEFQAKNTSSSRIINQFTTTESIQQRYSLNTNIEIGQQHNSMDVDETIDIDCSHRDDHAKDENVPSTYSYVSTSSRMDIDDSLPKSPLVVIDGPNVAHAYAKVLHNNSSLSFATMSSNNIEPDVRGIQIASSYFMNAGCRVQIVIPAYWLRRKPKNGNNNSENSLMMTEQVEILQGLQSQNLVLCSPPTDDDDAYAITIARREDVRSKSRHSAQFQNLNPNLSASRDVLSICGAFILSNDLFRDAIQRDISGDLHNWLRGKGCDKSESLSGRISFSFCDIGCKDLDFVANPRHLLVEIIEQYNRKCVPYSF